MGSGLSLQVSTIKDLVHHQANGRALVIAQPISLATSNICFLSLPPSTIYIDRDP